MGIITNFKVMTSWLALLAVTALASASFCPQGKQYLSPELEKCVNCTECSAGEVVAFPCEIHRDTVCGPIGDVLRNVLTSNSNHDNNNNHHSNHVRHKHNRRHRNRQQAANQDELDVTTSSGAEEDPPFSSAETLVWDWQAIALTSAVFACILFFLAITLYSLHQAKQWRRLKDNFDADVEELSARLSLMAAISYEKGEILEPRMGPITDGNYLNNKCVYLEQLLNVRKDTKIGADYGGNLYIEDSSNGRT